MAQPKDKRFVIESRVDSLTAEALRDPLSTTRLELLPIVQTKANDAATAALSNNGTVVAAAQTAVGNAMVGKDVIEGGVILEEGYIFAITDEDGRRTWIEADAAGKPTQRAGELITEKVKTPVAEAIGIADISTDVSGMSIAIVDEDGRRTWLEADPAGKPTARAQALINAGVVFPAAPTDPVSIIQPSSFPMVVGKTYKLYPGDITRAKDVNHTVVFSSSGNGGFDGQKWIYTPDVAKTFTLTIKVLDRQGVLVKQLAVPVTVYAAPVATGKRHLAIGDSITRAGNYSYLALTPLTGATAVGTRTYNDALFATEGRGGWSLASYFSNFGHPTADSPFLFPTNVAGAKFWGNTEFWRKVSHVAMNTLPVNGYDFDGFQKMARNWGSMASAPIYDVNGYPLTPAEGDVVVNPTKAAGSQFEQYVSGVWTTIATPTMEFSFSKYMARYAAAYPNGGPTSISIMLETNDFFSTLDDSVWATWRSRMDTVIASIRAWSATVPFIVILAPTGGPLDKWVAQTNSKFEFDNRIKDASERIIAAYDTAANRTNKVYVASFLGEVSPENMSDYVHPAVTAGHEDMSAALSGMLAKLITEGA